MTSRVVTLSMPWRLDELPSHAVLHSAVECGPYPAPWQHHPERQCAAYRYTGAIYTGSVKGSPIYRRCALLAKKDTEFCGKHARMFAPTEGDAHE